MAGRIAARTPGASWNALDAANYVDPRNVLGIIQADGSPAAAADKSAAWIEPNLFRMIT
jgi:hypothetical protein